MDCLFCKIINNEISSLTIYEDNLVKVFLDINPTTNGNSLIVPKTHYQDIRDIPDDLLVHMNQIIKKPYPIYQKKLCCDGLTISHNTDYGQEIKHFHIHFIPRYKNDQVKHSCNKDALIEIEKVKETLTK